MFATGIVSLSDGSIDFDTDTIRCVLMKKSFIGTSFNETTRDGWGFLVDIPDADIAKSGTFKAIGTNDIVIDTTNDDVNYAGGTVSATFPTVTANVVCEGIVVFKSLATETLSPLICVNKFSAEKTADGGTFTVNLNADGLFQASFG